MTSGEMYLRLFSVAYGHGMNDFGPLTPSLNMLTEKLTPGLNPLTNCACPTE